AWREVTAAADEDEETTYYHVSPFRMQRGTVLNPREHGRGNFDDSSGEHTYMTPSPDRAEQYRYMLWEQGHPEQHMYQVRPHGPVEEDPNDPEAVRTKHKVTIDWLRDGDNDDWFDRGEPVEPVVVVAVAQPVDGDLVLRTDRLGVVGVLLDRSMRADLVHVLLGVTLLPEHVPVLLGPVRARRHVGVLTAGVVEVAPAVLARVQ